MIGYDAVIWGLEGARDVSFDYRWGFAACAALDALDAVQWKAPEVRRAMARRMANAARAVTRVPGPVPPSFYRFLAACLLVSLREAW